MVEAGSDHWKVRYIRTLREHFHVYVDQQGVLRTDHLVRFLCLTVIRLHYNMTHQDVICDVAWNTIHQHLGLGGHRLHSTGGDPYHRSCENLKNLVMSSARGRQ